MTNLLRAVAALAFVALLVGCEKKAQYPKRHPVSGRVLVDGKPVVRAVVAFHPTSPHADGKSYGASTFTDEDGVFRMTTIESGDGAVPGEYVMTVVANYVAKGDLDVTVPDLLKGKYADPKTSPLRVEVKEGVNDLSTFDLHSK